MHKPSLPALRFDPHPLTPTETSDFQQLQALLKAAQAVKALPGNLQILGDPVVVVPIEVWLMGCKIVPTRDSGAAP